MLQLMTFKRVCGQWHYMNRTISLAIKSIEESSNTIIMYIIKTKQLFST